MVYTILNPDLTIFPCVCVCVCVCVRARARPCPRCPLLFDTWLVVFLSRSATRGLFLSSPPPFFDHRSFFFRPALVAYFCLSFFFPIFPRSATVARFFVPRRSRAFLHTTPLLINVFIPRRSRASFRPAMLPLFFFLFLLFLVPFFLLLFVSYLGGVLRRAFCPLLMQATAGVTTMPAGTYLCLVSCS